MRAPKTTTVAQKKLNADALKKRGNVMPKTKKNSSKKIAGAPKRPPSAFFVFMEGFRKSYKEKFPDNKSMGAVGKAGGEKWKSMSENEKAPFVAEAKERKDDYEKTMKEFQKKLLDDKFKGERTGSSQKSISEVNDSEGDEASS